MRILCAWLGARKSPWRIGLNVRQHVGQSSYIQWKSWLDIRSNRRCASLGIRQRLALGQSSPIVPARLETRGSDRGAVTRRRRAETTRTLSIGPTRLPGWRCRVTSAPAVVARHGRRAVPLWSRCGCGRVRRTGSWELLVLACPGHGPADQVRAGPTVN